MPLPITLIGEEAQANSTVKQIVQLAMGVPLVLDAAPTTSNGLLPEGRWGILESTDVLYISINGTTYSVALTAV